MKQRRIECEIIDPDSMTWKLSHTHTYDTTRKCFRILWAYSLTKCMAKVNHSEISKFVIFSYLVVNHRSYIFEHGLTANRSNFWCAMQISTIQYCWNNKYKTRHYVYIFLMLGSFAFYVQQILDKCSRNECWLTDWAHTQRHTLNNYTDLGSG